MTPFTRAAFAALALAGGIVPIPVLADSDVPALLPETFLENSPVGTWRVQVTTFDCTSRRANPPFESLLSFGIEGNEVETTNNPALQPGQRSPALGTWGFIGLRSVALTTRAYILFSSPKGPIKQGTQVIRHTIRLTSEHSFNDTATLTYLDRAGMVTFTGCATATGERL